MIACSQQPEIKLFHVCCSWKMWRAFTSSAPTISIRAALPEFFVPLCDWLTPGNPFQSGPMGGEHPATTDQWKKPFECPGGAAGCSGGPARWAGKKRECGGLWCGASLNLVCVCVSLPFFPWFCSIYPGFCTTSPWFSRLRNAGGKCISHGNIALWSSGVWKEYTSVTFKYGCSIPPNEVRLHNYNITLLLRLNTPRAERSEV